MYFISVTYHSIRIICNIQQERNIEELLHNKGISCERHSKPLELAVSRLYPGRYVMVVGLASLQSPI